MKRLFTIVFFALLAFVSRAEMKPNFIDYLLSEDKYEQVVRIATRELERHPKDGRLYSQRATAYLQLNDLSRSLDDLTMAIRYHKTADKSLYDLYRMRGILYEYMENPKAALRDYNRLIRLSPNSAEAYQLRGELYEEMGQSDKAQRDFKKVKMLNL
ncbi:MAG: tetratricopeptide repeat protein [Paludibacteraceae bacterium]|nr:tetratricopeptide repeat protein [Paludibacteraceae bacterium]